MFHLRGSARGRARAPSRSVCPASGGRRCRRVRVPPRAPPCQHAGQQPSEAPAERSGGAASAPARGAMAAALRLDPARRPLVPGGGAQRPQRRPGGSVPPCPGSRPAHPGHLPPRVPVVRARRRSRLKAWGGSHPGRPPGRGGGGDAVALGDAGPGPASPVPRRPHPPGVRPRSGGVLLRAPPPRLLAQLGPPHAHGRRRPPPLRPHAGRPPLLGKHPRRRGAAPAAGAGQRGRRRACRPQGHRGGRRRASRDALA
mmetsp:Transcript_11454/g.44351  ORF Transcript_11454/g.44351 Transcript_11454/m.44351 type:complete len:256 (-) Transcript_11454:1447-2214(-)